MVTTVDLDRSSECISQSRWEGENGEVGEIVMPGLIHVRLQVRFHLKKRFSGKTKNSKPTKTTTIKKNSVS